MKTLGMICQINRILWSGVVEKLKPGTPHSRGSSLVCIVAAA
jgi:hypothetical protein